MSSLPRRKRNRVAEAAQRPVRPINPMANIPVGKAEVEELLKSAKEVHQHNAIVHLVMLVNDDESNDVVCLFCGGKTRIKKPYEAAIEQDIFTMFKQFHAGCLRPQQPVGMFNVDMGIEDKKNPLYINKGTGVTVELREIKVNNDTKAETFIFADVTSPDVILQMPKEEFEKFFVRKED